MNRVIFVGLFVFVGQSFAALKEVGQIQNIDRENQQMTVEISDPQIKKGDKLMVINELGESCEFVVSVKQESKAITDISGCRFASELAAGRKVGRSMKKAKPEVAAAPVQSASSAASTVAKVTGDSELPTIDESWYTLWGLGYNDTNYGTNFDSRYAENRTLFSMDILGFYWPMSDRKTMVGFVVNAASDNYQMDFGTSTTLNSYLYSLSAHQFYGRNIGDGWFARADAGLARTVVLVTSSDFGSYQATSDDGFGGLLGGGYGFAAGKETRFLLGGYFAHRVMGDLKSSTFSVTGNFLF